MDDLVQKGLHVGAIIPFSTFDLDDATTMVCDTVETLQVSIRASDILHFVRDTKYGHVTQHFFPPFFFFIAPPRTGTVRTSRS